MEIHQSSLIYSPRNKGPQPVGKIQRADEKKPQKTRQDVEVTLSKNASKTDLTPTYSELQDKTKQELPSLQFDTITNLHTQKALTAYNTEQNQIPQDNSALLVSGVDYIV